MSAHGLPKFALKTAEPGSPGSLGARCTTHRPPAPRRGARRALQHEQQRRWAAGWCFRVSQVLHALQRRRFRPIVAGRAGGLCLMPRTPAYRLDTTRETGHLMSVHVGGRACRGNGLAARALRGDPRWARAGSWAADRRAVGMHRQRRAAGRMLRDGLTRVIGPHRSRPAAWASVHRLVVDGLRHPASSAWGAVTDGICSEETTS
jgi:hypothetical protein